jgi:glycosyltransferase involved in cell wall biosynthesis
MKVLPGERDTETPLVTAIIIFLNEEKFLADAIESVLQQTCRTWELLLVDDGSTDSSSVIARRYADRYRDQIRYLEHPAHTNRGMSASRNLGIRHMKGEFVAFLDADDVWLHNKLERQIAIMEEHPRAQMVYGATELWYGWTGRNEDVRRDIRQTITVQPDTLISPPDLFRLFLSREAITPCPSDVLVRRDTVGRLGGFVDSFGGMFEDQVFFLKVALDAPVFVSGECWSRHRQHPNSSCAVWKRTGEYHSAQASLKFLTWVRDYLNSQRVEDDAIDKVLQMRLWRYRHPVLFRIWKRVRRKAAAGQNPAATGPGQV